MKRISFYILALYLLQSCSVDNKTSVDTQKLNADSLIKKAKEFMVTNTITALYNLDLALEIDKTKSAKIFYEKSLIWSFKSIDSSFFYINKAVEFDSKNAFYIGLRSRHYSEMGKHDMALIDMNQAFALDSTNQEYRFLRGICKGKLQDYEGALQDVIEFPKSYINDPKAYAQRAYIYIKLHKWAECIQDCNKSLELDPTHGKVYGMRGISKSKIQDFDGALQDYKKGSELGDSESKNNYDKLAEYFANNKHS